MDKNDKTITSQEAGFLREVLDFIGFLLISIYLILCLAGKERSLIFVRIIIAVVALIAYSIKLGIEIIQNEKLKTTIPMINFCLIDIIISLIVLCK